MSQTFQSLNESASRVSIPKGAIMSVTLSQERIPFFVFQFQKVRLWGTTKRISASQPTSFNSKRCDYEFEGFYNSITVFIVSIPKGAIMRSTAGRMLQQSSVFQFQKVRLWVIGVSAFGSTTSFQFQKVRLWAGRQNSKTRSVCRFQFQKVRLWAVLHPA